MKLSVPFIQLPLLFDAAALAAEIAVFDEGMWRPHPSGTPGNTALPLVAVDGDAAMGDALDGPMRPTPALERSPYMLQVLGSLGAVLGRTRLMRLSGRSEVQQHVDFDYYWNERVRVHVPILTQPEVRFACGDEVVNMAQGECWIFDTWRQHNVYNDANVARIHLVVDTVGSTAFWDLVNAGRTPAMPKSGWLARFTAPQPHERASELMFESVNSQSPMSYWELRGHVTFLLGEVEPQSRMQPIAQMAGVFVREWQTLWFHCGADDAALPRYRQVLDGFLAQFAQAAAGIKLRNGADLPASMRGLLARAVRRAKALPFVEGTVETQAAKPIANVVRHAADAYAFDRPVFIVSPPRSGSSLFFETLARAPGVCTVGGESHGVIEGIGALSAVARGYDSNRLDESDASPEVIEELRRRFAARAKDREQRSPQGRIRLLEKTPKNALRVPFLARAFPDAVFVYLYRDPRQVLSSMMEAWETRGFRTYPELPGWSGLPWSLLLTPGWRNLVGYPLAQIVATQWETTTRILLDDLDRLPSNRRCVARYDGLIADPDREIRRICQTLELAWDSPLGIRLPMARHTVSAPDPEKWRRRQHEIEPLLAQMTETVARAAACAER